MQFLKQSTEITIRLGPFIDKTDGVTEETGLAGNATEISKAGGAYGAGPTLGTHDTEGYYPITLTTTHTNTVGPFTVKSHDNATHLPVWAEFMVLPANAYDSLVAGTDSLDVEVLQERGKYALGAVWIGPTANTNTVSYVDGIVTNPVSTIAAAKTIADALKIRRFMTVRTGATQIAAAMTGYDFDGQAWSLTTTGGSRDVGTSSFNHAELAGGTFAGTSGAIHWYDCDFPVAVSVGVSHMTRCVFGSTLTLTEAGDYDFVDCASVVAGTSAPVFAVPAGTVNISFRRWSGGIRLTGLTAGTTVSIDMVSGGTVTLEGTGATVVIRGMATAVVNSMAPDSGSVTQTAVVNQGSIADAVWDEALAGHVAAGSAGAALGAVPSAASVADAVWDEAIAGHLAAGTTGAALSSAAALTGLYAVVLHTQTSGAVTVPSVVLDIYDSLNTTLLGRVTTDSNGDATVNIDAGTYQVRPFKASHSYTTPQQIVVAGAGTKNITLTALTIPAASSPDKCSIYGYLYKPNGAAAAYADVVITAITPEEITAARISGDAITTQTDANGYFAVEIVRSISVRLQCSVAGVSVTKTVPAAASQEWSVW